MENLGLDVRIFGIGNTQAYADSLHGYGLNPIDMSDQGACFDALNDTAIIIRRASDAQLRAAIGPRTSAREIARGGARVSRYHCSQIASHVGIATMDSLHPDKGLVMRLSPR